MTCVVFKSLVEGHTHVFRPGEPMLQILILPVTADFALKDMDGEEAAERELRARRIPVRRWAPKRHGHQKPTRSSMTPTATFCTPRKAELKSHRARGTGRDAISHWPTGPENDIKSRLQETTKQGKKKGRAQIWSASFGFARCVLRHSRFCRGHFQASDRRFLSTMPPRSGGPELLCASAARCRDCPAPRASIRA